VCVPIAIILTWFLRLHTRALIRRNLEHSLVSTKKEISSVRAEIAERIDEWRPHQVKLMAAVRPLVEATDPCDPENQPLYLPSSFPTSGRSELGLTDLARMEACLREGQAGDLILQLRRVEKTLSAHNGYRKKNVKGQAQATRSRSKIEQQAFVRDCLLETYESCRGALKSLDHLQHQDGAPERFPALTRADLYRKGTTVKWQLGDTYRPDGLLWVLDSTSDVVASYDNPGLAASQRREDVQLSKCPQFISRWDTYFI
jgi:hypothetical protein